MRLSACLYACVCEKESVCVCVYVAILSLWPSMSVEVGGAWSYLLFYTPQIFPNLVQNNGKDKHTHYCFGSTSMANTIVGEYTAY